MKIYKRDAYTQKWKIKANQQKLRERKKHFEDMWNIDFGYDRIAKKLSEDFKYE